MADVCEQTDSLQWKNLKHQYYATFSANLIAVCHSSISGWFAPATPLLMSKDTPLASGPFTMEQLSWIGSINSIGALLSIFTFGFVTSMIGCKRAMTFLAIPAITFWLIIIFASSFYHVLIARFTVGLITGGAQSTVVLYISEIANDNIRGKLGTTIQLAGNCGTLIAYIFGASISYHVIPYICICVPIVFFVNFILLPNTPQYFLRKGYKEKAEKSLKYYKGCRKSDTELNEQALKVEFEKLQSIAMDHKGNEKVQLKDLCERRAIKGMIISVMLGFLSIATGSFTIMTYSVEICDLIGMKMSSYLASIIIAVFQLMGTLCTTQLADTLGRKTVLITSFFGSFVGLLTLSTYLYLNQHNYDLTYFNWVPVTSLAFIVFMASAGVVPLAGVCTLENLPSKVRTIGVSSFAFWNNLSAFLFVKYFPILLGVIEMHGCMFIFSVFSFLGIFFVYYAMEETNGKRLDATVTKNLPKKVAKGAESA